MSRRTDEGTGEVESLAGRIDPKQMGDRAMRTKPNVDRARQSCVARRRTRHLCSESPKANCQPRM